MKIQNRKVNFWNYKYSKKYFNQFFFLYVGLLPRVLDYLFSCIARQTRKVKFELCNTHIQYKFLKYIYIFPQANGSVEYLTRASFLEIYNERIYDLMDPGCHENGLHLRETLDKGVYVEGFFFNLFGYYIF